MDLRIRQRSIDELGTGLVLAPEGPIRARTAEQFREHVDGLLGDGAGDGSAVKALVLDLAAVDSIDSSTAGFLLNLHDRLRDRGGNLALADLQDGVQVVIDSIGLTTFFTVCESVDEALQQLG